MLIDDHTALARAMGQVEDVERPTPRHFSAMRAITHVQAGMFATLPAGPGFDTFYLMTQQGTHAMVLDSLHHWHAVARNEPLRESLALAIQAVEKHLERAQVLQTEVAGRLDAPAALDTAGPPPPPAGPSDTVPPIGAGDTIPSAGAAEMIPR